MDLLFLSPLDAAILLAKITIILCWSFIMISFSIRVILGSILDEIYIKRPKIKE